MVKEGTKSILLDPLTLPPIWGYFLLLNSWKPNGTPHSPQEIAGLNKARLVGDDGGLL